MPGSNARGTSPNQGGRKGMKLVKKNRNHLVKIQNTHTCCEFAVESIISITILNCPVSILFQSRAMVITIRLTFIPTSVVQRSSIQPMPIAIAIIFQANEGKFVLNICQPSILHIIMDTDQLCQIVNILADFSCRVKCCFCF